MTLPKTDLEWMYKHSGGVRVSAGGKSTWGHWDPEGFDAFAGTQAEVSTTQHVLSIPTGKLVVGINDQITVDGQSFIVNRPRLKPGGDEVILELRTA